LNVVVCLKQTLDPEIPSEDFVIDPVTKWPELRKENLVTDSYAANALELAIKLKEACGASVTVLTVGEPPAVDVLRKALAVKADRAVRVWGDACTDLDAHGQAHILACAIRHLGGADVVLFGRQSADLERGLVGSLVAAELGYPCVTLASGVTVKEGKALVRRELDGGHAMIESPLPVALTVTSHKTNLPRLAAAKDTMMAVSKPITLLSLTDIGVRQNRLAPRVVLRDLFVPATEGKCELVPGHAPVDQANEVVDRLRARKVL
jgi:electron transfer flavoprotein beta subunit